MTRSLNALRTSFSSYLHVNIDTAMADQCSFKEVLMKWLNTSGSANSRSHISKITENAREKFRIADEKSRYITSCSLCLPIRTSISVYFELSLFRIHIHEAYDFQYKNCSLNRDLLKKN